MPPIRTIHWATVPAVNDPGHPGWALAAVWPSPIEPDACFVSAGFTEFDNACGDDEWDADWANVVRRLLAALSGFGEPFLINESDVFRVVRAGFLGLFSRSEAVSMSPAERLILSSEDDRFQPARVGFGSAGTIRVTTDGGHPILWLSLSRLDLISVAEVAHDVANGRPVSETHLRWECLAGDGSSYAIDTPSGLDSAPTQR